MLTPLIAIIAPFMLWPVEILAPYPYIFEEVAKLLILRFSFKSEKPKNLVFTGILIGLLFSVSESVLYLFNIYLSGSLSTLLTRFVLTTPMHILTSVILAYSVQKRNKALIVVGFIGAAAIHYFYNYLVGI